MNRRDRQLGMDRDITRRDFLNGVGLAVSGSILSPTLAGAADHSASLQNVPGYYPPTREGMRGSHPGSFETAHLIRDGKRWDDPADSIDTGEEYDLVVVGGGISGLSAAYFFQKEMGRDARILVIDNHDDFGGHAKRNEYHYGDRMLIDLGGTAYIENPREYPAHARELIAELGIDVSQAEDVFDHDLYPSMDLRGAIFFEHGAFGKDKLVTGRPGLRNGEQQTAYITLPAELENAVGDQETVREFLEQTPLSEKARDEIVTLFCGDTDYLAGLSMDDKVRKLGDMTYIDFLEDVVGATEETIDFFLMWRASYMGNGVDLSPALAAMRYGLPGPKGLGIADYFATTGWQPHNYKEDFHFPDGNASVARLLVRRLIPAVAPGDTMHDIVSARFDYGRLDQPDSPVRIRLNSTAVHVRHVDSATVEVTYVEGDTARRIRANHCVLACYHAIIPHICPELPDTQKFALANTFRMPLVSISVLLDNWRAFARLGIKSAYCPTSFASDVRLTYPLVFDDYQSSRSPDEPITLRMYRIPLPGKGAPAREQFRMGRHELLEMPFETFERNVRDQLGRMLQAGGFDPSRDIQGITVNRWPHGYAVGIDPSSGQMNYFSADRWSDNQKLWLSGRTRHGRIAIANTDAAASAMTESAIEQAHRAARELLDAT
jgi:spermidine dehydrogenase